MKLKRVNEMLNNKFDYDKIINILKKSHGWGFGTINFTEDFESNDLYYIDPVDDNDYVEQFHIFLTDLETGRMRGQFRNEHGLKLGRWKMGIPVESPTSIYNKLM